MDSRINNIPICINYLDLRRSYDLKIGKRKDHMYNKALSPNTLACFLECSRDDRLDVCMAKSSHPCICQSHQVLQRLKT